MQISAEIRWFWQNSPPSDFEKWFRETNSHCCPAGGGIPREDQYLRDDSQTELSLKNRGGKKGVEVKGLVSIVWDGLTAKHFTGPIEIWTKWTSLPLKLDPELIITVEKQRWLRKFDTGVLSPQEIPLNNEEKPLDPCRSLPILGCNVEMTKIKLQNSSDTWWTFGFEAFGTIRTIENDLRAVATILSNRQPPALVEGLIASYPTWINKHAY